MPEDQVFQLRDGWFCIVNGMVHGPWLEAGYAEAGMQVEQRRALRYREVDDELHSAMPAANRDI